MNEEEEMEREVVTQQMYTNTYPRTQVSGWWQQPPTCWWHTPDVLSVVTPRVPALSPVSSLPTFSSRAHQSGDSQGQTMLQCPPPRVTPCCCHPWSWSHLDRANIKQNKIILKVSQKIIILRMEWCKFDWSRIWVTRNIVRLWTMVDWDMSRV